MIEKYKQDNGLSVLLEPVSETVSVSVGLWVKTGSRNERIDQYGYAHFVEHMLFKGTEKYTAKELARQVDRVGGQHNAATNREYTCYYINVVSDYLELGIDILSEMYYNSLFDPDEIEKEKNIIIEEIRMYEDTPDEFIHDIFMENMLKSHPLAHSILGTVDGIQAIDRNKLLDFYNEHYLSENSIFVIAGNFDVDNTKRLIDQYFSRKRDSDKPELINNINPPERVLIKHIEKDLEQVHFCLGTEGFNRKDEGRWPLYLLSTILGGSMSSRLFQNIREREGISYSVYSFHSSYKDHGIFGIYCATSPDNFNRAIELITQECSEMLNSGISKDEFLDAKTFMKGNLALSLESIEVKMGQLAKNEIIFGKSFTFNEVVEKINNISLDGFKITVDRLFKDKELSLISVGKLLNIDTNQLNLKL